MKAFTFLLAAFVLTAIMVLPVNAQQGTMQQADTTRGMMGMMHGGMMDMMPGGMMQMHMQMMEQMMQDPLHHTAMLVHVLPTMQEPLALSGEQVTQLKQRAQQFVEQKQAHQKQMMTVGEQLQELLSSDDAAPDQVRSLLEEQAMHRARMQALAYETGMQMKDVLTAEQRTKLTGMSPMQLHHHMMANMTMMEMMQAMHGPMLPSGMMKDGMMKQQ